MEEKKNRQSWLDAGLQTLANDGPEGLRIMSIAQQLGVTKGSFYWHFKNLEEYRSALLLEWERRYTQEVIDTVQKTGGDANTGLHNLFTSTTGETFKLGRAIRSWAITDQRVREVQARVDQKRLRYVADLLRGIGWPKEEAMTLGRWAYCAFVGHAAMEGPAMTEKQIKLVLAVLMRD